MKTARSLARAAEEVGAGKSFSVAIVFACQEFETRLIAGITSLAGKRLPDGLAVRPDARAPDGDLEIAPRDAKRVLNAMVDGAYQPSCDQTALAKLVGLDAIRARNLRSFRRFEHALACLKDAIQNDRHIASPSTPS